MFKYRFFVDINSMSKYDFILKYKSFCVSSQGKGVKKLSELLEKRINKKASKGWQVRKITCVESNKLIVTMEKPVRKK